MSQLVCFQFRYCVFSFTVTHRFKQDCLLCVVLSTNGCKRKYQLELFLYYVHVKFVRFQFAYDFAAVSVNLPLYLHCDKIYISLLIVFMLQFYLFLFALQDLITRGADVTRNSVQKSVCVLSNLVIFANQILLVAQFAVILIAIRYTCIALCSHRISCPLKAADIYIYTASSQFAAR